MIAEPERLIKEFRSAVASWRIECPQIEHFLVHPPHSNAEMRKILRDDCFLVYTFSMPSTADVLKVGVAGPKSDARVLSMHYRPNSAPSNLAKQLLASPEEHARLGAEGLTVENVGDWIRQHTDRDFFRMPTSERDLALMFESYLRLRRGALFENFSGKATLAAAGGLPDFLSSGTTFSGR